MITFHIDGAAKRPLPLFGWVCQAIQRRKIRKAREAARARVERYREFREEIRGMFNAR